MELAPGKIAIFVAWEIRRSNLEEDMAMVGTWEGKELEERFPNWSTDISC